MKPQIAIIGYGNIGKELGRRITEAEWDLKYLIEYDGVFKENIDNKIDELQNYPKYKDDIDLAFLAIPALGDGKIAHDFIQTFTTNGTPIVTCEKGALSKYYTSLEQHLNKIGYSATVGGGSRMLPYAQERMNPQVMEIHAIVNGTLNFIFNGVGNGREVSEVVQEAQKLGYSEPGADNVLDVINGEATGDVPKKTAILCNILGLTKKETQPVIQTITDVHNPLTEKELKKLMAEARDRRYIISLTKQQLEEDIINGFATTLASGWHVNGGFKKISENPHYSRLVLPGVNNALMMIEGKDGKYGTSLISGPGAGAGPTANSMMIDAYKLLQKTQ